MFEHGEYVQVFCNDDWVTCRVRRVIGDMVYARRADGFIWLGVQEFVRPV